MNLPRDDWRNAAARMTPGGGTSPDAAAASGDRIAPVIPIDTRRATRDDAGAAEAALLRLLRGRSLSVAEAHAVLAEHGVEDAGAAVIIAEYVGRGYLGDDALAEQLIHAAVTRQGQSRAAIARLLQSRGIDREVAEAALDHAGDDADRARELARHHAASLRSVPVEVAVRRLAGRLQRRGYSASVALSAARSAMVGDDRA